MWGYLTVGPVGSPPSQIVRPHLHPTGPPVLDLLAPLDLHDLLAQTTSRNEEQSAGRRGVEQVFLTYGLVEREGDLSTDSQVENPTD